MTITIYCPECGSSTLREIRKVLTFKPVTAWRREGEDEPFAAAHGVATNEDSGEQVDFPYDCAHCRREFEDLDTCAIVDTEDGRTQAEHIATVAVARAVHLAQGDIAWLDAADVDTCISDAYTAMGLARPDDPADEVAARVMELTWDALREEGLIDEEEEDEDEDGEA